MFGLTVLIAIGLYFLVSLIVVRAAINYARKHEKSVNRWGWGAALVMYLIMFWDWIPTLVAHTYYCSTEAGFWVYKTPEQWKIENPKMEIVSYEETLVDDFKQERLIDGNKTTFKVNKRSKVIFTQEKTSIFPFIKNRRVEETLFDDKHGNYLTRKITFQAGQHSGAPNELADLKFWVNIKECSGNHGNVNKGIWESSVKEFMRFGESI